MKKHRILKSLITFVLALALSITLLPSQFVYAADGGNYDGSGTGNEGVSGGINLI